MVTDPIGNPVEGIKVSLESEVNNLEEGSVTLETMNTVADGTCGSEMHKEYISVEDINRRAYLKLEDVDGSANGGEFVTKTVAFSDLKKAQTEKQHGWVLRTYEYTGTITLTPVAAED